MFDAIARNRPVVALESTIISHGMPYPRNIEVARGVEAVIRSYGAVPATCAIINGIFHAFTYHFHSIFCKLKSASSEFLSD